LFVNHLNFDNLYKSHLSIFFGFCSI